MENVPQTQRISLRRKDNSLESFWVVTEEDYARMREAEEVVKQLKRTMEEERHMKKKEFYKVVRIADDGRRVSVLAGPSAALEYIPGNWVRAKKEARKAGYHPLVFTSLGAAKQFRSYLRVEVWRCSVRGVKRKLPPLVVLSARQAIELGWISEKISAREWESIMFCTEALGEKKYFLKGYDWPFGTVMVKEVRLEERVE